MRFSAQSSRSVARGRQQSLARRNQRFKTSVQRRQPGRIRMNRNQARPFNHAKPVPPRVRTVRSHAQIRKADFRRGWVRSGHTGKLIKIGNIGRY